MNYSQIVDLSCYPRSDMSRMAAAKGVFDSTMLSYVLLNSRTDCK